MYLCTCDIDIVYAWLWLNMYMWTWQSSVFWYSTNQETAERRNPSDESWDLSSTWEARIIHAADIDILVLGSSRTAPTSPPGATAPTTTYRVTGFCWAFYHQWQMTSICLPQAHIKQMLAFNSSSWVQLQKLPFQTHNQPATLDPLGIQQISPVQLVEFLIQWRCSAPAGFQWAISTKTWCYLMLPNVAASCCVLDAPAPITSRLSCFDDKLMRVDLDAYENNGAMAFNGTSWYKIHGYIYRERSIVFFSDVFSTINSWWT